jgi:hypothetical protein
VAVLLLLVVLQRGAVAVVVLVLVLLLVQVVHGLRRSQLVPWLQLVFRLQVR